MLCTLLSFGFAQQRPPSRSMWGSGAVTRRQQQYEEAQQLGGKFRSVEEFVQDRLPASQQRSARRRKKEWDPSKRVQTCATSKPPCCCPVHPSLSALAASPPLCAQVPDPRDERRARKREERRVNPALSPAELLATAQESLAAAAAALGLELVGAVLARPPRGPEPTWNKVAQASASWLYGGCSQRQITPQAAPCTGQLRSPSPLGPRWPGHTGLDFIQHRPKQAGAFRCWIESPDGPLTSGALGSASTVLRDALWAAIPGQPAMTVNAAGSARPLGFSATDFERFVGARVQLVLREPYAGRRKITGILLRLEETEDGEACAAVLDETTQATLQAPIGRLRLGEHTCLLPAAPWDLLQRGVTPPAATPLVTTPLVATPLVTTPPAATPPAATPPEGLAAAETPPLRPKGEPSIFEAPPAPLSDDTARAKGRARAREGLHGQAAFKRDAAAAAAAAAVAALEAIDEALAAAPIVALVGAGREPHALSDSEQLLQMLRDAGTHVGTHVGMLYCLLSCRDVVLLAAAARCYVLLQPSVHMDQGSTRTMRGCTCSTSIACCATRRARAPPAAGWCGTRSVTR